MKKTLILVVDRDDDFGAKAGVVSPVIGVDACINAATALGVADPEDSDTNALYAAINIYRDMEKGGYAGDFDIALICGDQKVGHRSDMVVVNQLEQVIDTVKPDRAILVGDGAEDEYIYPIITSRLPIDSVRKVYVKQAPGVEGTFYIFKRIIEDPQKRRRFLAPVAWVLMFLAFVYILSNLFTAGSISNFVQNSTTSFIVFFIGVLTAFYAYNLEEKVTALLERWDNRAKRGSVMTVFLLAALVICILGVVIGVLSVSEVYLERDLQVILVFATYSLWFFIFGAMVYLFGVVLDSYMYDHVLKFSYIALIINALSLGLIISGALDYSMDYAGIYKSAPAIYFYEIITGFALAVIGSVIGFKMKANERSAKDEVEDYEVY